MKESQLRKMIRNQITESLEENTPRAAVATGLGRIEKMAGVKMLKKALGAGGPAQQAAGLHAVVRSISGDNPQTAKLLSRLLLKKGITSNVPETPSPAVDEKVSSALSARMGRVDKTQAMKMMRKALANKPATQQAEFVADLVKNLDLKGNITLLIKKIRQVN